MLLPAEQKPYTWRGMRRNLAIGLVVGAFVAGVLVGHFAWESVFGYRDWSECVSKELRRVNWGGNASKDVQRAVKSQVRSYCRVLHP
jgi:hypothetical protein